MTAEVRPGRFSEPIPYEVPERFELTRVQMPMHEPFVTAHGVERDRDLIVVRALAADGVEGWGECSTLTRPGYSTEHTEGAWAVLVDELAPAALEGTATRSRSNHMAFASLEVACCDLALRRLDRSLTVEFGRGVERIPVGVVVGVQSTGDALLRVVEGRVAEGYAQVKLKVTPEWFVDPLRAVRRTWPDLALAADANGSLGEWWDGEDSTGIEAIDDLGLDYLEQPLPPGRADAAASLMAKLANTPVAFDESIVDRAAFGAMVQSAGVPFVVNVKPARLGGLGETRELLHEIAEAGCSAFVGGMLESGIGRATAVAVATSPVCNRTADLGPSDRYFGRDLITDPFVLAEGTLRVPAGPGIGVEVDLDAIDAFAVGRVTVERP